MDWTNPQEQVTEHFTVADMCMLHSWNRLANESDGLTEDMQNELLTLAQKLEEVRSFLGCPMNVHCCFRSPAYNKLIGAPPNDVHSMSMACDFDCNSTMSIADVVAKLEPQLESLGIRMERNTTTWVHIDIHPVVNARYFLP